MLGQNTNTVTNKQTNRKTQKKIHMKTKAIVEQQQKKRGEIYLPDVEIRNAEKKKVG